MNSYRGKTLFSGEHYVRIERYAAAKRLVAKGGELKMVQKKKSNVTKSDLDQALLEVSFKQAQVMCTALEKLKERMESDKLKAEILHDMLRYYLNELGGKDFILYSNSKTLNEIMEKDGLEWDTSSSPKKVNMYRHWQKQTTTEQ